MMSDGAAVMKKLGRIAPFEIQTCINHGIHLAINDSLIEQHNSTAVDNFYDSDYEPSSERSDNLEEIENYDEVLNLEDNTRNNENNTTFSSNIKNLIDKVLKNINIFRYSPLKNDLLTKKNLSP